jgi:NAD+ synthase (glutamine-hydrolysing)
MTKLAVAAAVLNQTPLDWDGNRRRIVEALAQARTQGASLVCLPELCLTGYGCEDAFLSPDVHATALEVLADLLPATRGLVVSFGLPLFHCGAVFNTACLVADGRVLGFVGKQNLAGEGIHYEPRWFKPWPANIQVPFTWSGGTHPLGDLLFDLGGIRVGFEICEDAWVAERPGAMLARRGCEIILNPSASHFAFGKHEVRRRFVLEGSRAFSAGYVYANLLGNEAGRAIYDGDAMIASCGELLAAGRRLSYADALVTTAVLDISTIRMHRGRTSSFRPSIEEDPQHLVRDPYTFPVAHASRSPGAREPWEQSSSIREEEFTRVVALGLYDYLRKSHSRGFVVSLSGGADSATLAVLVAKMVEFGIADLGLAGFFAKLPAALRQQMPATQRDVVRLLLTTVYQATRNSSTITRDAARTVAGALGAAFLEFDVDALVQQYTQLVEQGLQRSLTWERDDLALQNIQARVRAPGVWLLANVHGALLLSTSNRSEAAVGYATMDGDTSGGLAPIAGIDKAFLRRWLRWLETEGPCGSQPLAQLAVVNAQAPTAELRPGTSQQRDEEDLMPYDVLDTIEKAAIRDKQGPLRALQTLAERFPQHERKVLAAWVERFFRLWCRNQWKRERYAPSFHLDDENLDPKTWCRFPILSGGYERELTTMWQSLAPPGEKSASSPATPQLLYSTKYLDLVQRGHWYYATRPGISGVVCIAGLTVDGEIVLVEQYRPPVNGPVIEFPAGLAGDVAGQEQESLLDAARRELLEETGYEAAELRVLFTGPSSAGLTDETISFVLATGLRQVAAGGGDGTESIRMHRVPLVDAWRFLETQQAQGVMVDSRVPTCLYLLEHFA